MAELRDEECQGGKVDSPSASCGCGNTKAVQGIALNSLRGAAIGLCISPDELRELLLGGSNEGEAAKLRVEIAELKSENARLKEDIKKMVETNTALQEFIVVKW